MTETIALPLWAVAAAAAVVALLAIVTVLRVGSRQAFGLLGAAVILAGAGWLVLDRLDAQAKAEQRRNIEARLAALQAHALRPNSNLSCLDTTGGNVVYEACERVLFSSPEQISAALNYVSARIDLLREIAALPDREEAAYAGIRIPLMRSIEADRFGLVAQVLTARDGCKPGACYAFDLVQRREQLVANMTERAYEVRIGRFASTWSDKPTGSGPALASTPAAAQAPAASTSALNLNFPSASSIPPVSRSRGRMSASCASKGHAGPERRATRRSSKH